jgi:putative ABC transport system permease protein
LLDGRGEYAPVKLAETGNDEWQMFMLAVDEDFIKTYDLKLIAGRGFSTDIPTDADQAFILNETAAKQLGSKDLIGKEIHARGEKGVVIGIVNDFHALSLKEKMTPSFLRIWMTRWRYLSLKIRGENLAETMIFLKDQWQAFVPNRPFEYKFLDEDLAHMYRAEMKLGQIFSGFALFAILVACLGLFGLTSFATEQRTKEIGIRKILGASIPNIIFLLSTDFLKWVVVANIIAWPIAHYAMKDWLTNFAYQINLGWEVFALSGGLALMIALLTVSSQAIKVARSNPVDALRHE